jgi:ABC-type antimicrobial peptide transport system permease subunit
MKEGANVEAYCNMVREKIKDDNYFVGCIGISSITPYDQLMDENSYNSGYTNKLRFNIALAALFLFSLSLGVIGTFWMQTKQRRGEVGVMRSFGASRNSIMRLIVSEGVLLATTSVVIGCLIYLQYAIKEGLNLGFYNSMENEDGSPLTVSIENASNLDWVNTFGDHYLIVSAIIYLIILAVVIIGVSIPAKRLSRIPPVEALREE